MKTLYDVDIENGWTLDEKCLCKYTTRSHKITSNIDSDALFTIILLTHVTKCGIIKHSTAFHLLHTSMIKCCKEAEAFISLEKRLFNLHLPPWERPAGSEPLRHRQKFVSGLYLVPDCLKALLLRCWGCANTMRLHGLGWVVRDLKNKAVTHGLPTTPFHYLCRLHFTNSKKKCCLDILPSPWTLVHLDFAKAGFLRQWGPALSGLPVPSPHPAGPGTGRGSWHLLPALQRADKRLRGRSSSSWPHTLKHKVEMLFFTVYCCNCFTFTVQVVRKQTKCFLTDQS